MNKKISKSKLRKYFRIHSNNLNTLLNSQDIISQLINSEIYQQAKTVMCYVSFGNEINTHPLINRIIYDGKNIVTPTCNIEDKSLFLSYNKKFPKDYHKSSYGILEVPPEKCNFYDIERIDLIIVPGLAFDKYGHRLGNGAGYYDRFLSQPKLSNSILVGLVSKKALIYKLPSEDHDITMNYIITQDSIYKI
jgi:5-formyltetrahydrofolate cyclo-ligase